MIITGITMLKASPELDLTINSHMTEKLFAKATVIDMNKANATIKQTRMIDTIL